MYILHDVFALLIHAALMTVMTTAMKREHKEIERAQKEKYSKAPEAI